MAVAAVPADAATRYGRATNNWNTTATWSATGCTGTTGATVPGSADDVIICDSYTITVNSSPTVLSISIPAGGLASTLQITSNQTLTVNGNVSVTAGSALLANKQILLSNNAVLTVNGSVTLTGGTGDDRFALLQVNGATVNINSAGSLNIGGGGGNDRARVTLANVSQLNVTGDIVLGNGGFLDNGNTTSSVIRLNGDFTHSTATNDFVSAGGVFQMIGTSAQAIDGATGVTTNFFNLVINNSAGDVTINHPIQLANAGTLTLTSGRIVTGATPYVGVGLTAAGTISGASSASYVIGNLRRYIPTGTQSGIMFPVGGSTAAKYAQVQIDFPNVGTAGTFQVAASTGNTDHPNIGTSVLDSTSSVNRYWTLTNTSTLAYAASGASITFNYPAGDVDGGAVTSAFAVGDYSASAWSYATTGTLGSTSTQVTGVLTAAIAGDYAIAELAGPYSYWRMNEGSWNGTASEVGDFGSSSNPGTASSLAATKPTTANATPAIAGTQGTCRYGVFNRANKDYVSLPSTYPNLATGSFSITGWIRTTDRTQSGQRILIDDESEAGGWGFSLADSGTAGALRIYSRGSATQTLDTSGTIANNTWYFVAATVNISGTTTVATLYIYTTAGALADSATATWTGFTWGTDAGRSSIGGETNSSGEATNSFGFAGNIDELRVYRAALSQSMVNQVRQLTNPCETTDHYAITGSTTGVTCDVSTVQFTAHNAAHTAVLPVAGTRLTLSTSTGTGVWQAGLVTGGGTWTPSGTNNGAATYDWSGAETTFSVRLRHNTAATVNINVLDTNSKADSATEDLSITFADTAFRVTTNGTSTATIGTQLSGKNSNVGFGAQTLYLQAIRTDTNTGSCVGLIQSQTVTIEMAAARINPTVAPGSGSQVGVLNSSSALVALGTGSGVAGAYTSVSLAFDASSMAPLVVNYADAGSVSLFARYQLPTPPTATFVAGSSNTFVVRPFALRIAGPPSGRTGSGSTAYARAGQNWPNTVTVSAVVWANGDDVDNDGIPDSDAVLIGNAVTTNFGAESTAATAAVTHALAEPAGGNSGSLTTSLSAFTNGVASTSAAWSEVGLINLFATSTNYLGSGQNVRNSVSSGFAGVGRFYPDHFFVPAGSTLTNRSAAACSPVSSFTYMDEPFRLNFIVHARNSAGVITQNYGTTNTFAKLVPATVGQLGFGSLSGTTNLTTRLDTSAAPTGTFISGVATIGAVLDLGRVTGPTVPDGPYPTAQFGIAPSDSDSVVLRTADMDMDVSTPVGVDHKLIGSTDIRFGRMRLQNAMGSALLDLPVSLTAQYYNGSAFVTNTVDSCTTLLRTDIRFDFVTSAPRLAACETITNPTTSPFAFSSGVATLRLTKPTSQHEGVVDLSVNLNGTGGNTCITAGASSPAATSATLPWLQGNWNGATAYSDNPRGRHTFGLYKAADQFIYLQENY